VFRDRIKKRVRRLAIKAFGMEFDTEDRDPNAGGKVDPADFDPSVIPKLVDGDGDTPGPNHKEDIGRTWVAAQMAGGVAPFFVDIRSPTEMTGGVLPRAHRLPHRSILEHTHILPAKSDRVIIYDQTGDQGSIDLAAELRSKGWSGARRLKGGYAEWIEYGEDTTPPKTTTEGKLKVGDAFADGDLTGCIVDVRPEGELWIWSDSQALVIQKK
jgi:rhodanese-related sulfurtransferase